MVPEHPAFIVEEVGTFIAKYVDCGEVEVTPKFLYGEHWITFPPPIVVVHDKALFEEFSLRSANKILEVLKQSCGEC